jgi:Uma2 family endonuclease
MTTKHAATRTHKPTFYPESDGLPVGETEVHFDEIVRLFQTIRAFLSADPMVHVTSDLFVYYEEGNPKARIAPDVMVVRGIPKLPQRQVYLLWEEQPPTVIFEVTSKSSRSRDQVFKRELHARLGVQEYYLYDPLGRLLRPPFQALMLQNGAYRTMVTDSGGSVLSEALGLRLRLIEGRLRLFDARTGAPLLSPEERAAEAERRVAELERRLAERDGGRADGERA